MSNLAEIKIESREKEGGSGEVREERWSECQDYDIEFLRGCDEGLNTALINAGLLSAVISALIIYTHPQFQSDPNEESATLLRALLFKFDSTIFGDNVPQVPQWTDPPCTIIATQTLLFLSLATTLTFVSFVILAKRLLGLYAFVDSRDSIIERDGNPERRHIRFSLSLHFVMFALSLLLRFALLLFSCAVSVYLWEINTVIAAIILVTAICVIPLYSPFGL